MGTENLDITNSAANYTYDYYEVQNLGFSWSPDDTPEIKVYLNAEAGYYFNIKWTSQITVNGGTVKSTSRESNDDGSYGTLVVDVLLPSLANQVFPIETATMTPEGVCSWSTAENAGGYEVKFMRNNTILGGIQTVTGTTLGFGQYMTKAAPYHFMVRPINKNDLSVKGKWVDSNRVTVTEEMAKTHRDANAADISAGTWEQAADGWKFKLPDGTYAADAWRLINGQYYYFKGDTMATGWVMDQDKWYYMDPVNGNMWKNAVTPDGYSLGIDGSMIR